MMALAGYTTRFNQVLPLHHGAHKMVLPGAFDETLSSTAPVKLLLDHRYDQCVGSTDDILEIHSDQWGLAFRAKLPDTTLGQYARQMAQRSNRDAMSIGFNYDFAAKEVRRIDGLDVVVIAKAWLYEISFLCGADKQPAIKDAFAIYTNVDYSQSLRDESDCCKYLYDGAANAFTRSLRNLNCT
jgi:HK97 family phage prohead protease